MQRQLTASPQESPCPMRRSGCQELAKPYRARFSATRRRDVHGMGACAPGVFDRLVAKIFLECPAQRRSSLYGCRPCPGAVPRSEVSHAPSWFVGPVAGSHGDGSRRPARGRSAGANSRRRHRVGTAAYRQDPGPDWVCQDGGWPPLGHPSIRSPLTRHRRRHRRRHRVRTTAYRQDPAQTGSVRMAAGSR